MNAAKRHDGSVMPTVNQITFRELREILRLGFADFYAAPAFGLFFGGVYAIGGLAISACMLLFGIYWMLYPFVIGFALIGPFIAAGLYDVSRRRERKLPLKWSEVLGVVWLQRRSNKGAY